MLSDKIRTDDGLRNVIEDDGCVWVKLPVVTETIVSFKPPKIMQTEDGYAVCFSDSRICEEAISRYAEQIDKKVLRAICEAMGYVPQRTCRIEKIDSNNGCCSSCGASLGIYEGYDPWEESFKMNYCPECGAKVVK